MILLMAGQISLILGARVDHELNLDVLTIVLPG